jgi:hypothetical protein
MAIRSFEHQRPDAGDQPSREKPRERAGEPGVPPSTRVTAVAGGRLVPTAGADLFGGFLHWLPGALLTTSTRHASTHGRNAIARLDPTVSLRLKSP